MTCMESQKIIVMLRTDPLQNYTIVRHQGQFHILDPNVIQRQSHTKTLIKLELICVTNIGIPQHGQFCGFGYTLNFERRSYHILVSGLVVRITYTCRT